MASDLLTILITTRNRVDTLRRCLDAIYASDDLSDVKDIVVVDDGSEDGTEQFLDDCRRNSKVTTVVRHAISKGPAVARNAGVRAAQGEYVLIMGDDVLLFPPTLRLFCEHIRTHDMSAASVIGNILPPPENTTAFEYWSCYGGSQFCHYRIPPEKALDAGDEYFYTSNVLTPTALLREFPFDESFPYARYEDRELAYRLKKKIQHRIHYLAEAKSYHVHKMPFVNWLRSFERFTWAAIHFANLYPEDADLPRKVGIREAERRETFCMDLLLEAVSLVNRYHKRYFDSPETFGTQWAKSVVELSFRQLQEFFRINHFRRHLMLAGMMDITCGMRGETAMERILAEIDNGV
jgi:glycosyltransferase involved in cell wall biosynthesis